MGNKQELKQNLSEKTAIIIKKKKKESKRANRMLNINAKINIRKTNDYIYEKEIIE
jgi:hypothetical protein